ncbi:MAG: tyrosine-type recombinase/integrase [Planctomycetota bacterium]
MTVEARYDKNRKRSVLPLPTQGELVLLLQEHLSTRMPHAPAFNLTRFTAKMLVADLQAAGIEQANSRGEVLDFHGLRTSFVSNLARAGVHPKIAQQLARHSDIRLTMQTYTKLSQSEQRERQACLQLLSDSA